MVLIKMETKHRGESKNLFREEKKEGRSEEES